MDSRDAWPAALTKLGISRDVARQVIDVIQSVERDPSSNFSLSWTLEDVFEHPAADIRAVANVRTILGRTSQDAQFDTQFPLYQVLNLKAVPTLKLECGQCLVDYNYVGAADAKVAAADAKKADKKADAAAANIAVCENLFYAPVITEQVAVEALQYAAALVRHVFVHLYDFIMKQPDDMLTLPLLELGGDGHVSDFQALYDSLAVAAGSKLASAIKRIRCAPCNGAYERCLQPPFIFTVAQ
jgi:hypothetical protein